MVDESFPKDVNVSQDVGTKVVIKGIDIPFMDLVSFLVKLAVAAIPAYIIVWIIFVVFALFLRGALNLSHLMFGLG